MVWREKLVINMIIWFFCFVVVFFIVGFFMFICLCQYVYSFEEFLWYDGKDDNFVYVVICGQVFDIGVFYLCYYFGRDVFFEKMFKQYGGMDIIGLFFV